MCPNTVEILTAAGLSYLLITVRATDFENSVVICKILRLFVNTFTAYDKYSVLKREYLTHPIHMQLSQKQKKISDIFSAFLKAR